MLRFRDFGCFVFEFWVLRFRDLGASCFGLRFRVLRFRNYPGPVGFSVSFHPWIKLMVVAHGSLTLAFLDTHLRVLPLRFLSKYWQNIWLSKVVLQLEIVLAVILLPLVCVLRP